MDKKYKSQQRHIHLALLVRYLHIKQHGMDVILKPMLDYLKKLATEGFTVTVDEIEHIIRAALATLLGENQLT